MLTVTNSTVNNNTASVAGATPTRDEGSGGGIAAYDRLTISNTGLSGNTARVGGGIFISGGTVKVGTTLFQQNIPDNIFGPFTNLGGNTGI